TYEKVRELCHDIPIVVISGYADMACQCVKRGAQDYLIKTDITPGLISRSLMYAIERKKLEVKKLEAENQFKNVMQNTPLGAHMYELSEDELYFYGYNPAADKILKIDHSQFLGLKITDAFPEVGDIREAYIKVIETGEPWKNSTVEYEDEKVSGCFSVYAFRTGPNKMATTFEDITERMKIEKELKNSREKYRELVEVTKAGIYEIDLINNKFTYVNDVLCRLSGWSKEELLKMPPTEFLTEKSLGEFLRRMKELEDGEFIDDTFEYEVRLKNGLTKWIIITAKFKENEEGIVTSANVVAIDITNQKHAEEESKIKEEIIFNELEVKIKDWRKEITLKSVATTAKLEEISFNIHSMTKSEVHQ
ncbi:MAG: PAS domain S-box protein, partial [Candidatus Heimdallarchaeaceae archaeon]